MIRNEIGMPHTPLDLTAKRIDARCCCLAVVATLFAATPSTAASQKRVLGAHNHVTLCAYKAQKAVAQRRGLSGQRSDSLALRIYADPDMAQEADNAFDACVRNQRQ